MIAIAANSPLLGGQFTGWRVDAAAGVEPAGLGALRPDPRRQRRRPGQRLGALRAEGAGDARAPHAGDGRGAGDRLGAVRGLGRRPGAARRPPADARRPGLPPDHAVPAGAAARLAGDPLPRQRARRGVAGRGVHARHAARRPGRRRHRRRGHRAGGDGVGPRRADRPRRPAAARRPPPAACRPPPNARPPNSRNRCSSWCVRSNRDAARPTTSPTGWSKYGIAHRGHRNWRKGSCDGTRNAGARADQGAATARCGWSTSTTPNCAASTTR